MFVSKSNTTEQERTILRKLRVWIAALAVACLLAGIGIGAMLSGRPTVAQPDMQIARAPEALSASFAEIAKRVEPAVVNIETTQNQPEISEKDEDKEEKPAHNSAPRCVRADESSAEGRTPNGSLRPRSATAMLSKPYPTLKPAV